MIQLIVDYAKTRVSGDCVPMNLIKQPLSYTEKVFLTKKNRAKAIAYANQQGHGFSPNKPMTVERFLYDEFDNTFPTGMLHRIMATLDKHQFLYEVIDLRAPTESNLVFPPPIGKYADKQPRPYQQDAIDTALFKKRGILRIACGGGKTLCAGEIIKNLGRRTVFLVNRGGLLYQAKEVFEEMLGGCKIGQVGDGIVDVQQINVVMIQTLTKHLGKEYEIFDEEDTDEDNTDVQSNAKQIQEMLDSAELVFMDECHCIGARTAFDCLMAFKNAEWRIGLSATPVREDGKDIYFEACFGPKLVNISFTYLIEHGFLVRPYICFVKLNGAQLPTSTKLRHSTIYSRAIVNNEFRNRMAVAEAKMLYVNGHHPLMLVQQLKHGNILKSYMPEASFIHGKDTISQRKEALTNFCSGDIPILIATTILDEAIDIPPCDAVIMTGGGASYARTIQRISRGMRIDPNNPNKKMCVVIDFFDQDKYLDRHCFVRQNTYRSEKAFEIILPGQPRPFEERLF